MPWFTFPYAQCGFLLIMVVAGDYYVLLGWFGLPALPTQLVCLNQIWPHNKKAFFCNVDRRGMIPLLASKMQKRLLPLKAVTKIIIIPYTILVSQQPTYGIYYIRIFMYTHMYICNLYVCTYDRVSISDNIFVPMRVNSPYFFLILLYR